MLIQIISPTIIELIYTTLCIERLNVRSCNQTLHQNTEPANWYHKQLRILFFQSIVPHQSLHNHFAFFAVIITGKWPTGLRDFVVGLARWIFRVNAWFYLLADPYPPFSLR